MSANIYWAPVEPPRGRDLNVPAPSWFLAALERAFGVRYPELSEADLPKLEGMAAMWDKEPNPFAALAEAVKEHGHIKVWAEY